MSSTETIDCSPPFNEITAPGTIIMSPNYPSPYDNSLDCQVTVRFSDNRPVLIQFDPLFDIESHSSCNYDYLEVREGASARNNLIVSKLCGDTNPDPIQSTGNSMTLIFHSDNSISRAGFKITVNLGNWTFLNDQGK